METFLPAYNDPLFSLLMIVFIAFIVALSSYLFEQYHKQKEEGKLLRFLEGFDATECSLESEEMPYEEHMLKPLSLLATAFEKSGEYPKAISLYLYLIKHTQSKQNRNTLMQRLAHTYLYAGFLERACQLYLEILRKNPKNIPVLHSLCIVYERMHQFEKAKEVLLPLEVLHQEVSSLHAFLAFLSLHAQQHTSPQACSQQLLTLLQKEPRLYVHIMPLLFKLSPKEAWRVLDMSRIDEILDILWFLPKSQLDFAIITQNSVLSTLYYLKGVTKTPSLESGHFLLDLLALQKREGKAEAELCFTYLCQQCKQHFPMRFHRCPNCMAIYSIKVEEDFAKKRPKRGDSLL